MIKKKLLSASILTIILFMAMLVPVSVTVKAEENSKQNDIAYFNAEIKQRDGYKGNVEILELKYLNDFEDNEIFVLLILNQGYAIANKITGTIYERSVDSNSPYENYENSELYYGGFNNYIYKFNNSYYNCANNILLSADLFLLLKANVDDLIERDIMENGTKIINKARYALNFKDNTVLYDFSMLLGMPVFCDQNNIQSMWDEYYLNFNFLEELFKPVSERKVEYFISAPVVNKIFLDVMNGNSDSTSRNRIDNPNVQSAFFQFQEGYIDMLFGMNKANSCAQVAVGMLLQLYDRTARYNWVPSNKPANWVLKSSNAYTNAGYMAEILHQYLRNITDNIESSIESIDGATLPHQIKGLLDNYFSNMGIFGVSGNLNASYNNMKGALDGGNACIAVTGASIGSYYNLDTNAWENINSGLHSMVTYGYTTFNSGVLREFLCHSGWYSATQLNGNRSTTSIVYIDKLAIVNNVTLDIGTNVTQLT